MVVLKGAEASERVNGRSLGKHQKLGMLRASAGRVKNDTTCRTCGQRCYFRPNVMSITPFRPEEDEQTKAALAEVERYCEEHPRSPTAVRRPRVMVRGRNCVALLGSTLEDGIAGIGSSVRAALRAFDVQYSNSLKPPRG